MKFLIPLLMLMTCVACVEDLTGKMFVFPKEGDVAHVRLSPKEQSFTAITICLRFFTDLERDHALFSLATTSCPNSFLIYYQHQSFDYRLYIWNNAESYRGLDFQPNTWHSICTTWESTSGLVQMWFDGKTLMKKYITNKPIQGQPIITLGQEQDSYGGKFSAVQSFVGMMADVHMWDHVLSPCEIQKYQDTAGFTPGNVLSWAALDFKIVDQVLIETKEMCCTLVPTKIN